MLAARGGQRDQHHVAAERGVREPQPEVLGEAVPACGPLEDRAGRGVLVQAAAPAARAGLAVGIDAHVVEGGGAARSGLEGPAVEQDRQAQPRVHVHRRAQSALGLLAAPVAAQGRARRRVRADHGHVQAVGELAQQSCARVSETVGDRDSETRGRAGTCLWAQHRHRSAQRLADLGGAGEGAQRHRDPGAQRAGEVHAGQGETVRVERAPDRPARLVVQPQQRGALAAVGLREADLAQQPCREQPLDRVGDRRGGDAELAGDLHPAGLGASAYELEDGGVGRRGAASTGARRLRHRGLLPVPACGRGPLCPILLVAVSVALQPTESAVTVAVIISLPREPGPPLDEE